MEIKTTRDINNEKGSLSKGWVAIDDMLKRLRTIERGHIENHPEYPIKNHPEFIMASIKDIIKKLSTTTEEPNTNKK